MAELLSVLVLMPYFLRSSAPRSSRGPVPVMLSGLAIFFLTNPAIMASAIIPEPTNPILFSFMVLSKIWERPRLPLFCQFYRLTRGGIHC
jgi:hypothetical protein